jgi:hypothetical protein
VSQANLLLSAALLAAAALSGCKSSPPSPTSATSSGHPEASAAAPKGLKPVSAFADIADPAARSVALFTEAGRVITHPRCTNCHPPDDKPRQGLDQRTHIPLVSGGERGHGVAGLPCNSCHQAANMPIAGATEKSVPGHPKWALAPIQMAWIGKSLGQICEQIKDPKRNGNHTLAEIHHHMAEDSLVGWGWNPGPGFEPVPGTQKEFGELIKAWIDTGARCPTP